MESAEGAEGELRARSSTCSITRAAVCWKTCLLAQSKDYYKSDLKIRTTIAKVIRKICQRRQCGDRGKRRCGHYSRYPQIRPHFSGGSPGVEGPEGGRKAQLEYREGQKSYAQSTWTRNAPQFRDFFQGKGNDYTRFDMKLNCMTLETPDIIDIIIGAMHTRSMI
jgi:hypothetical protein